MLRGRSAVVYLILRDVAASTIMFAAVWLLKLGAVALYPVLPSSCYRWAMRTFTRAALWAWPENRDAILDHTAGLPHRGRGRRARNAGLARVPGPRVLMATPAA